LVTTRVLSSSTKLLNIDTALCKYQPQLSLKSIISHSLSIYCSKAFENSLEVSSQNIFIAIYAISVLSKILESTDGILILSLVTSIVNILVSHCLKISNATFVQAGHLILSTASNRSNHSNLSSFAFIIISPDKTPNFLAGDHFIILSTNTQSSFFSTTAHIHSKSQDSTLLNFSVSEFVINSLCLSHNQSTSHLIAESSNSSLLIQLES
jgi:hypothetical protein